MDHGLTNTMAGDYASVVYWYQDEPHEVFPPLPARSDRRPAFPWTNPLQWFLVALVLAGLAGTAVAALRYVLRGG
jgi:hypothetical protein